MCEYAQVGPLGKNCEAKHVRQGGEVDAQRRCRAGRGALRVEAWISFILPSSSRCLGWLVRTRPSRWCQGQWVLACGGEAAALSSLKARKPGAGQGGPQLPELAKDWTR